MIIILKRAYPAALEHGNMENVRCFAVRCEAVICVVLGGYEPWRFLLSNSFSRSSPTTIAKSACTVKATSQAVGGHRYQFSPKTTTKKDIEEFVHDAVQTANLLFKEIKVAQIATLNSVERAGTNGF